jgi:hypothetical protein
MLRRVRFAVGLAVSCGLVVGSVLPARAATAPNVTTVATGSGTVSQYFSILPTYRYSITGSFVGVETPTGVPVTGTFDLELYVPWWNNNCANGNGTMAIVSNVGNFTAGVICYPPGGLLGVGPGDLTVVSDSCYRCYFPSVKAHFTTIQGSYSPPPTTDHTSTAPIIASGQMSFTPVPTG